MSIILTDHKKEVIEILKKQNRVVLEVTKKTLYVFHKNIFEHSSEEKFLNLFKRELERFHQYQVGDPEITKIKKL